jgi:hypothetical protein
MISAGKRCPRCGSGDWLISPAWLSQVVPASAHQGDNAALGLAWLRIETSVREEAK